MPAIVTIASSAPEINFHMARTISGRRRPVCSVARTASMFAIAPTGVELAPTLCGRHGSPTSERISMLYTIAVVLLILWAVGLVSSYTMGGLIHILLVVAIVVILVNVITGRR